MALSRRCLWHDREGVPTYFADRIDPTRETALDETMVRSATYVTGRERLVGLLTWTDLGCGV
jgi:hypothetical protein